MTEAEIREKTREILEAYQALTGEDIVPDITEFLHLRKSAIDELSAARGRASRRAAALQNPLQPEPVGNSVASPAKKAGQKKEKTGQAPDPAPRPVQPEPGAMAAGRAGRKTAEKENGPYKPPMGEEPAQQAMSDFDILRGIKDPWN